MGGNVMAGIACVFSKTERINTGPIKKMLGRLRHRGRGKSRIYTLKRAVLGKVNHLVENEVELKESGPVVVADGKIFNDDCSTSPEEIISEFYKGNGEEFVHSLDGAFAFALADGEKFLAARDPLGLKPLYYTESGESLAFASEIKALVERGEDIKIFPPGYYYSSERGFVKYFKANAVEPFEGISKDEAAREIRERLIESVDKNYEEDKNIGIFLSGGIDSSVIAAAAKEVVENLDTFSVGVTGSNDILNARKVASHIGARHHEYIYDIDEMLRILPEVIYHLESFDMFLVRSAVANYFLSRMACYEGKNMIFCGEGGDELFGGYHYLKNLEPSEVEKELIKLTFTGHANGFQRVDRMTSAFAIDGRMPFMNSIVAGYACRLPVEWKILDVDDERTIEKWILRKAFENDLPDEIVWRRKQKFFEGAGSAHMLHRYAEENISDEEFLKEKYIRQDFQLRSKEELLYYRIFKEFFPHDSILDTIGRTATTG
jgi:asparagine synthase (glutamine-hydrolysing)